MPIILTKSLKIQELFLTQAGQQTLKQPTSQPTNVFLLACFACLHAGLLARSLALLINQASQHVNKQASK